MSVNGTSEGSKRVDAIIAAINAFTGVISKEKWMYLKQAWSAIEGISSDGSRNSFPKCINVSDLQQHLNSIYQEVFSVAETDSKEARAWAEFESAALKLPDQRFKTQQPSDRSRRFEAFAKSLDLTGDGVIDIEEFKELFRHLCSGPDELAMQTKNVERAYPDGLNIYEAASFLEQDLGSAWDDDGNTFHADSAKGATWMQYEKAALSLRTGGSIDRTRRIASLIQRIDSDDDGLLEAHEIRNFLKTADGVDFDQIDDLVGSRENTSGVSRLWLLNEWCLKFAGAWDQSGAIFFEHSPLGRYIVQLEQAAFTSIEKKVNVAPSNTEAKLGKSFHTVELGIEQFPWASTGPTPYREHKNAQMYTPHNMKRRRLIRKSPLVKKQINKIWMLLKKNENGLLEKEEYIHLMIRLCKILNPDFNYEDAVRVVAQDFVRDTRGAPALSYDLFFNSMFEVADLWCPDVDEFSYSSFLERLFRRMTVKIKRYGDGRLVAVPPAARITPAHQADLSSTGLNDDKEASDGEDETSMDSKLSAAASSEDTAAARNLVRDDSTASLQSNTYYVMAPLEETIAWDGTLSRDDESSDGAQAPPPSSSSSFPSATDGTDKDMSPNDPISMKEVGATVNISNSTPRQDESSSQPLRSIQQSTPRDISDILPPSATPVKSDITIVRRPAGPGTGVLNQVPEAYQLAPDVGEHGGPIRTTATEQKKKTIGDVPPEAPPATAFSLKAKRKDLPWQQYHHEGVPHTAPKPSYELMDNKGQVSGQYTQKDLEQKMIREPISTTSTSTRAGLTAAQRAELAAEAALYDGDSTEEENTDPDEDEIHVQYPKAVPVDFQITFADQEDEADIEEKSSKTVHPPLNLSKEDSGFALRDRDLFGDQDVYPQHAVDVVHMHQVLREAEIESALAGINHISVANLDPEVEEPDYTHADGHAPYHFIRRQIPLSIWLIGKPHSGRSQLAEAITERLGVVHVTPAFCIQAAQDSNDEKINDILEKLREGEQATSMEMLTLLKNALLSDRVGFHGYVLGEVMCSLSDLEELSYERELQSLWPPQYIMEVDMSDEDVLTRVESQRFTTGADLLNPPLDDEEEPYLDDPDAAVEEGEVPKIVLVGGGPVEDCLIDLDNLKQRLQRYKAELKQLRLYLRRDNSKGRQLVYLDACQSIEQLMDTVMHSVGQYQHIAKPERLDIPMDIPVPDVGVIREVLMPVELDNETLEVDEVFGIWQAYCPVTLLDDNRLEEGREDFAVSYLGCVHLFVSQEKLEKFEANPAKYIMRPPKIPSQYTVMLLGGNSTGKTTMANLLSTQFGWHVITSDMSLIVEEKKTELDAAINDDEADEEGKKKKKKKASSEDEDIDEDEDEDEDADEEEKRSKLITDDKMCVFDGFPNSANKFEKIQDLGVRVDRVVYLMVEDLEELPLRHKDDEGNEMSNNEADKLMDEAFDYHESTWPQIKDLCEDLGIRYEVVDAAGDVNAVFDSVRQAIDPFYNYRRMAQPTLLDPEEIEQGEDRFSLDADHRQLRFDNSAFCPVCLIDKMVLFPGLADLPVRCQATVYSVCSEEHADQFAKNAQRYHIFSQHWMSQLGPPLPELRVALIGARASGKSTFAEVLGKVCPGELKNHISLFNLFHPRLIDLVEDLRATAQAEKERADMKGQAELQARAEARAKRRAERMEELDEDEDFDEQFFSDEEYDEDEKAEEAEPVDMTVLDAFLKMDGRENSEYYIYLNELLDSEWINDEVLDSLILDCLKAGGCVGQLAPNQSPPGFVLEIDTFNGVVLERLIAVWNANTETAPHIVIPIDTNETVCLNRLLDIYPLEARPPPIDYDPETEGPWQEEMETEDERDARLSEMWRDSQAVATAFEQLLNTAEYYLAEPQSGSIRKSLHQRKAYALLQPWLQHKKCGFQMPVEINYHDTMKLLSSGKKSLRQFGTFCPVCLADDDHCYDCRQLVDDACCAAVWSHFVIRTCSEEHLDKFLDHPVKYLQVAPPDPFISNSIAVIGPPFSGQSTLSQRLAEEFDLVYLNMELVLERMVQLADTAHLGSTVRGLMLRAEPIPDALQIACLKHVIRLNDCRCGYVLDGFPQTESQAIMMREAGIVVQDVFSIDLGNDHQLISTLNDRIEKEKAHGNNALNDIVRDALLDTTPKFDEDGVQLPVPELQPLFDGLARPLDISYELEQYREQVIGLQTHFQRVYNNIHLLDGTKSAWTVSNEASKLVTANRRARQRYRILEQQGLPAPLANMSITRAQIQANLSSYRDYCPVCWVEQQALHCSEPTDLSWTVEYHRYVYRVCKKQHMEMFDANPTRYATAGAQGGSRRGSRLANEQKRLEDGANEDELKKILPEHLPRRVCFSDCQRITSPNCELLGYCPVTLYHARMRGQTAVEAGDVSCTVVYRDKIYRLFSEDALDKFMRFPGRYWNMELPQKMPPRQKYLGPRDLLAMNKILAYFEQNVTALLQKAMLSFHENRYKYPSLSLQQTAVLYMALYLKAQNPRNAPHIQKKYSDKLALFVEHCELIPKLTRFYSRGVVPDLLTKVGRHRTLVRAARRVRRRVERKQAVEQARIDEEQAIETARLEAIRAKEEEERKSKEREDNDEDDVDNGTAGDGVDSDLDEDEKVMEAKTPEMLLKEQQAAEAAELARKQALLEEERLDRKEQERLDALEEEGPVDWNFARETPEGQFVMLADVYDQLLHKCKNLKPSPALVEHFFQYLR